MDLENELMDQLPDTPGLLTYYNLHRPQKGYGNLVLFQSDGEPRTAGGTIRFMTMPSGGPPIITSLFGCTMA